MNHLRHLAPQVVTALARRCGDWAAAEDATQEALLAAVAAWPVQGEPADPTAWLLRVAWRRMANQYRADSARRRREQLAAVTPSGGGAGPGRADDDSLLLLQLCCHPILTPAAAIPLTLRAVGGLTTKEIASAFLVSEPTMAQRISRAKARLRQVADPFHPAALSPSEERLRAVRHVLYLIFSEGHTTSAGPELDRPDLAAEAIRLARMLQASSPGDGEAHGLLGLMLLIDARRGARIAPDGALVPLSDQDRSRWDRHRMREGLLHATAALEHPPAGEYGLQAAINALHAEAPTYEATRWADIATLYARLEHRTGSPVVRLNRAVAVAMVEGGEAGLALLADLDPILEDHHRLWAARAHLYRMAGQTAAAAGAFRRAAAGAGNLRERHHLLLQASSLTTG